VKLSSSKFIKTRNAVLGVGILAEPLLTAYGLIAFILRKDLHATPFQIAVLTMLRPVVALLSLYWSHAIADRRDKLLSNVILAGVLSYIPFLFFPFIENAWFVVACAAFHMMMRRGGIPAWMEILKLNLPSSERGRLFSLGASISYIEGVFLAIPMGILLDMDGSQWKWLFPICALFGIASLILQAQIPIELEKVPMLDKPNGSTTFQKLLDPWRNAFSLLKKRSDYSRFQLGFMICGFGIMIIQPILPIYFVDVLQMSHLDMFLALSLCRGLGYALTASPWAQLFSRINIYQFTSFPCFIVSFFSLCLIFAQWSISLVYLAYFAYGVFLAGQHLSWNLAGTVFAKDEDSTLFTSVGVAAVGLRGAVAPPLGSLLCLFLGPIPVMGMGMCICAYSGLKMYEWGSPKLLTSTEP
jgi:hypothetical protein